MAGCLACCRPTCLPTDPGEGRTDGRTDGRRADQRAINTRLPRFPTVTVPPAHANVSGRDVAAASRRRCGTRPPQERLWRQPTRAAVRLDNGAPGAYWQGGLGLHVYASRIGTSSTSNPDDCTTTSRGDVAPDRRGAGPGSPECDCGAGPTEPSTARRPVGRTESHRFSRFRGWGGTRLPADHSLQEGATGPRRLSQEILCYAMLIKGGWGGAASGLALPGWSLLDSADSLRGGVPRDYRPGVGCDRSLPTPRTVPRLDPPSEPTSSTACFHRVVHSLSTYMHVKLRPKSHFSNFSTPHRIGVKMTKSLETSFCPDSDHQTRTQ